MKLSATDHARISLAIAEAETRTSGEIFCVLAERVSSYRDISLGWAAAAALILPLALVPLGFQRRLAARFRRRLGGRPPGGA